MELPTKKASLAEEFSVGLTRKYQKWETAPQLSEQFNLWRVKKGYRPWCIHHQAEVPG